VLRNLVARIVFMRKASSKRSPWQEALQSLPEAVVALDREWRPLFCNTACERLTGYKRQDIVRSNGEPPTDHFLPRPASLSGFLPTYCTNFLLVRKDRAELRLEATYTLVCSPQGEPLFIIAVLAEIPKERLPQELRLPRGNCLCLSSLLRSPGRNLDAILDEVERLAILQALRTHDGHRLQAATSLGISRSRLYRRIASLGIAV